MRREVLLSKFTDSVILLDFTREKIVEIARLSAALFIIEIIGVIAFAISGALKAMEIEMDIFGIMVLAIFTALGGGVIRDILINRFPVGLSSPVYFFAAFGGGLLTIVAVSLIVRYPLWLKIFDAMGLAVFSALGAQVGMAHHLNVLGIMLLGMLTGIGGGILRDVLANEVPLVFRQEVYALASLLGILVLWGLVKLGVATSYALIIGILLIFLIRLAAIRWNLNLPRIHHR